MTIIELESAISPDVYLLANAGEFIRINLEADAIGAKLGEGQAWSGSHFLSGMIQHARKIMRKRELRDDSYVKLLEKMKESEFDRLFSGIRLTPVECNHLYTATINFLDQY